MTCELPLRLPLSDHAAILDALTDAILVIDPALNIAYLNAEARRRYGDPGARDGDPRTCYALTHGAVRPCHELGLTCPVRRVLETGAPARAIHQHIGPTGDLVPEEITATPLRDAQGQVAYAIETVRSAAELLASREILDLMRSQLDLLRGIVPTCAACKRIRTPNGEWEEMEAYLAKHSAAEFTHSLCPRCVDALYPGFPTHGRGGTPHAP